MTRILPLKTILDAKGADGIGTLIDVADAKTIVLEFSTSGSAQLTTKFQGSTMEEPPAWGSAKSVANHFSYLQAIDLEDSLPVDGDDGVVLAGTDVVKHYELNVNGMKWFNAIVSGWSVGAVTVKVSRYVNN